MNWNPWKKIAKLESKLAQQVEQTGLWAECFMDTSDKLSVARNALENIAMAAGPKSSATIKRLAAMAQETLVALDQ